MRTTLAFALLALVSVALAVAPLHLSKTAIADSYIVVFHDETTRIQLVSDLSFFKSTLNVSYDYTYQFAIKGFAASLSEIQLTQIRSHPRVKFVEQNGKVHMYQACTTTTAGSWGQTRVSQRVPDLDDSYRYPNTGANVDVYVIDTGILTTHVDFTGRAVFGWKAETAWPNTDDNGHGTHVASTIGGVTYGIARGVRLIGVKVLSGAGSGSYAGVIGGVDFAVSSHLASGKASTANMSLGGGLSTALNAAVNNASAQGLNMVVAAGNDNANACNYSPASASQVISVGATDIGAAPDIDVRSYFSNYGTCTHVYAPGSDITAAWIGSNTATRTISGTSMASPHVCGVAALLLNQNPNYSFAELRAEIQSTATSGVINLQCTNAACRASPNLLVWNGCDS